MKRSRLLFAALIIGAAASCVKEANSPDRSKRPVEVVLEASWEDDSETKTHRVDDAKGTTLWDDGDQISLFFGSGTDGGSCFTTAQGGETASFSGVLNAFTAGGEGYAGETTYFWGVYPYNATTTCDNNSVTVNIPSVQPGRAGTYGPGVNVSVGRSENLKMGFYNVCSGFRFSVTMTGITEAVFRSNDDAPIVGDATVQFINGKPEVTSLVNTSSEVHLFPEGGEFEVGQKYFLEFIPSTFAEGFSVTLYDDKGMEATYVYGKSIAFTRSNFSGVSDINTKSGFGEWTVRRGNITFADPNFKAYCVQNFDTNSDGEISYAEASDVWFIDCQYCDISSMNELRFFSSLVKLWCSGNQLTSLDVSSNTDLKSLACGANQLTSLDVSNNTALIDLVCTYNQLTSLDVSHNTALKSLHCGGNQLTGLDVRYNTALDLLDCSGNQLTGLDISHNTALGVLVCRSNQLTSLDVSSNTALRQLWCAYNQLTSLDVSSNTALWDLECDGNQLTSLDVSSNTALTRLLCSGNQLTGLDVSSNTALNDLACSGNQLTGLDVSSNTALNDLACSGNQLTSLDVSHNTALINLDCSNNLLPSLDVSNNTALAYLDCSPMDDENGVNLLETLYVYNGQSIMFITEKRHHNWIPDGTVVTDTHPGTGEGTGDDEIDEDAEPVHNGHEYVDLGLSVKWATYNVGANSTDENGDYFAWGGTEPLYSSLSPLIWNTSQPGGYDWSNYSLCNGSVNTITKYTHADGQTASSWYKNGSFIGDNKAVLDPEDDAASVNWGGDWRMPTKDEIEELMDNCTCGLAYIDGKYYSKFTSKKPGYTDKYILFPYAGAFLSNYLQYVSANAGRAYCWSSSKPVGIAYDSDSAYYLHTTDGRASVSRDYRCYGMTVRAVLP